MQRQDEIIEYLESQLNETTDDIDFLEKRIITLNNEIEELKDEAEIQKIRRETLEDALKIIRSAKNRIS